MTPEIRILIVFAVVVVFAMLINKYADPLEQKDRRKNEDEHKHA